MVDALLDLIERLGYEPALARPDVRWLDPHLPGKLSAMRAVREHLPRAPGPDHRRSR